MHRIPTVALVLLFVLTLHSTLPAQSTVASSGELREWTAASHRWLQQRVTPNPAVPSPEPERRGLLVSYDISPDVARWYHRVRGL